MPWQILRPVQLASILFSWCVLASCTTSSDKELSDLRMLNDNLVMNNQLINRSTEQTLLALKDKLSEPASAEKAKVWFPRATRVQELNKWLYDFLETMKHTLMEEAGLALNHDQAIFREDDKTVVERFMKANRKDLIERMEKYHEGIFDIEASIDSAFNESLAVASWSRAKLLEQEYNFIDSLFSGLTAMAAVTMLSKLQNDARVAEYSMTTFCNNKIGSACGFGLYSTYSAIVSQTSSYVKPGEQIEVHAGVGSFSKAAKPEVTFRNKKIPINEEGVATYIFNAPGKSGTYRLPVIIRYTDQDGKEHVMEKNIEYTVLHPCTEK